ncbi:MAG TPA: P63C domain-containing protein [Aldersonia sp.]
MPYSMFRGNLQIGNIEIEGHVLSDGRRVLTQREVVRVLTRGRDSGNLSRYIARLPGADPAAVSSKTIQFRLPGNRTIATGYEATLLIEICDMYLAARESDSLSSRQSGLADMAETIVRATAKLGIIALIDEATGYQAVRSKQALQLKLQAFIAEDMAEWAQMFPPEFWMELARLEGVEYSPRNRPIRWGKYIMMFVYDAVDPDVGKELRKINPDPHFRRNHHQWLKQHGREKVNNQVQRVIAIMKLCDDMTDFRKKFAKVFQKGPLQLELWDELG